MTETASELTSIIEGDKKISRRNQVEDTSEFCSVKSNATRAFRIRMSVKPLPTPPPSPTKSPKLQEITTTSPEE